MHIDILGSSFSIQTDENPEYIEKIVGYYKKKVKDIEKNVKTNDPLKTAILTGIIITDEMFKNADYIQQNNYNDPDNEEIERITQKMLTILQNSLD